MNSDPMLPIRATVLLLPLFLAASVATAAEAYAQVLKNAERCNVDPERVVLAGDSAGEQRALSIPLRLPNILLILVDDMGYSDPGFLGGDIETPHLDQLAAAGTVFGRFSNHAKCEPSRASLMTGVHFQRQTHDQVTREFGNVTTMAERLRKAGYRTLATGKWHLPGKPTEHGFDRFFGLRGGASNHFDPTGRLELDPDLYLNRELLLDGDWKVYRSGDADWQLFDLRADGTESGDRSALHPERADAMIRRYNDFENSLETLKQK